MVCEKMNSLTLHIAMETQDLKKIVREFNETMERAKNRTDHLSATMARLYALHEESQNLINPDDLKA
jgi:hypothetical protein